MPVSVPDEDSAKRCEICPRRCAVNRSEGGGICGQTDHIRAARAALHFWEEPPISGTNGSGAVFFSGCSLRCIFCQNSDISRGNAGREITTDRLVGIFYELRGKGAVNINLVTPTHFAPSVAAAIQKAKKQGFDLPFIWNTGSYESTGTLRTLEGLADVYLPDLKYSSPALARAFSGAEDYPETARLAITEMVRQQPKCVFGADGLIKAGVIVRVLVLPGHSDDACESVRWLAGEFGDSIYISIMNQYTPPKAKLPYPELCRRLTTYEYGKVLECAEKAGVRRGFTQERGTAAESFIPRFDCEGIT